MCFHNWASRKKSTVMRKGGSCSVTINLGSCSGCWTKNFLRVEKNVINYLNDMSTRRVNITIVRVKINHVSRIK